jgi:hypothetical protein
VAVADDGKFVVVWQSAAQDGSGGGIFGRRFDSGGTAQAAEFRANSYTPGDQVDPAVAADQNGDFVVSWSSFGQDGSALGVFARRFDAAGVPQGPDFGVNRYTAGNQDASGVAMDDDGAFIVTWTSESQDGSLGGVFARRFDAAGLASSDEIQVNTYTVDAQADSAIGLSGDGALAVVAWESAEQDGSGGGVFAQRLESPAVLDIDGNGTIGALTDGLLVLRFLFGFTGTTLTAGVVGQGCTRCDGAAIAAYLQSLT